MSVTVVFKDEDGDDTEQECEEFEEGEYGLELLAKSDDAHDSHQVGYIPYESLEYARPTDEE